MANILRALIFVAICCLGHAFKSVGVRTAKVASGTLVAKAVVMEGDSEAFERITLARCATKFFDEKPVPEDVLKQVIHRPHPKLRSLCCVLSCVRKIVLSAVSAYTVDVIQLILLALY